VTGDNPEQHEASKKLFDTEEIFIPDTVILESEWVLRGVYELTRQEVYEGFRKIFGLGNAYVSEPGLVLQAIAWHEAVRPERNF
jgi:predicted nucleic-acid-binding protein